MHRGCARKASLPRLSTTLPRHRDIARNVGNADPVTGCSFCCTEGISDYVLPFFGISQSIIHSVI
jgi:hypothetical protein